MKLKSILGIIISIIGIILTIANWYAFSNGHEHSITLMILISICFIFSLVISIINLTIVNLSNSKK